MNKIILTAAACVPLGRERLAGMRFTGEVWAVPEGEAVFYGETDNAAYLALRGRCRIPCLGIGPADDGVRARHRAFAPPGLRWH